MSVNEYQVQITDPERWTFERIAYRYNVVAEFCEWENGDLRRITWTRDDGNEIDLEVNTIDGVRLWAVNVHNSTRSVGSMNLYLASAIEWAHLIDMKDAHKGAVLLGKGE